MKKRLLSFFCFAFTFTVSAQSNCGNLDFENQDYTGWTLYSGGVGATAFQPPVNLVSAPGSTTGFNSPNPFHAIVTATNSQYQGLIFPSNYQGGTIARVNHIGAGASAGVLDRTFTVTSNQTFMNFSYLVILSSGHGIADQPYFSIAVYDAQNQVIPGSTLHISGVGTGTNLGSGFLPLPGSMVGDIYKPWTPVTFDFSQYIGQVLRIRFVAGDCTAGGHGGHAYVDFDCGGATAGVPNVWPGDANYDLTVDFLDLFYVGAATGYTGTSRTSQGNSWAAAQSPNWNAYSMYLVNAKHADCDGNGTINNSDVTAISQNYGLNHPFKKMQSEYIKLYTAIPAPISITADKNTVSINETLTLDFKIGDAQIPVDSISAIGLTMTYPNTLFSAASTSFDCTTSVIGQPSVNMISVSHGTTGSIDLAVSRNNRTDVKNIIDGSVFKLHLKTRSDPKVPVLMNFSITNVVAIDKSGREINLSPSKASVQLTIPEDLTAITENLSTFINIGPNPVQNVLQFHMPSNLNGSYHVFTIEGKELLNANFNDDTVGEINTTVLSQGTYFVRFDFSDGRTVTKKFFKEQNN